MIPRLSPRRGGKPPERHDDRWILPTEQEWLVEGDASTLRRIRQTFPEHTELLGSHLLLLNFRGGVGRYVLPGLGEIELRSGKFSERHFDEMLRELSEVAAALPFAQRIGSGLPFERVHLPERRVDYHAFVYLQSVLSPAAPSEARLDLAVEQILSRPQRRLAPEERLIPTEQARVVGPRGLLRVLQTPGEWTRAGEAGGSMAAALRGHLPEKVLDDRRRHTVDTPENRFVRAVLDLAADITASTRRDVARWNIRSRSQLLDTCDRVAQVLERLRSHPMWREVGPMTHFPSNSMVLQRQHGYREILQHFIRLRFLSRIPIDPANAKGLLDVKNIATLYELWVFFAVAQAVNACIGSASEAEATAVEQGQLGVKPGLCVRWADGTRLLYNASYKRGGERPSTSVLLRPDVSLFVPTGTNRGLHLFDAKFRFDSPTAFDADSGAEASFKHPDIYKMHTYRDAIPGARSVWVVYPGSEYEFFPAQQGPPDTYDGVGAIPARPGLDELTKLLRKLLPPTPVALGGR